MQLLVVLGKAAMLRQPLLRLGGNAALERERQIGEAIGMQVDTRVVAQGEALLPGTAGARS